MRILMLAQFYPPVVGGEEQHVRTLSTELAARGHHVAVATLWNEGLPLFEMDGHVSVYRIRGTSQRAAWLFSEAGRRHAPPFPDPELVMGLRRIISTERPEIVHAHNWLVHSFLPLKAWSKARLVLTLHDYSLVCAKKSLMFGETPCSGPGVLKCLRCASKHYGAAKGLPTLVSNWAMGKFELGQVDFFLAVSRATAAGNRVTGRRAQVEVIPNFLPQDSSLQGDNDRELLSRLPGEPFLLFVGDMRLFKGLDVLLRAYAGLQGAPPLVLIGRKCTDTPAKFPPNVVVLGTWPRSAVIEAWRRSIACILPSVGPETFGIVVIEAMEAGRPVVASRIGGLADIVLDGETGFLVPPGDAEALRHAIARLLAEPELRERMGKAAKQRASEFKADRIVPRIERIYMQLLEEHPARSTAQRRAVAELSEGRSR
jgi:glycosyltransferase involved in cell wall biosynthesis